MEVIANPQEFRPGLLAHVEHHANGEQSMLVFVRHLRHAPSVVWTALTDPCLLCQWAPFSTDRTKATGGPAALRLTDGGTGEDHHATIVDELEPEWLELAWGDEVLRFDLAPYGGGTRLTLIHSQPTAAGLPRSAAGWHLCLIGAERLLDGCPIGPIVGRVARQFGWDALHDAYTAELRTNWKGWRTAS